MIPGFADVAAVQGSGRLNLTKRWKEISQNASHALDFAATAGRTGSCQYHLRQRVGPAVNVVRD